VTKQWTTKWLYIANAVCHNGFFKLVEGGSTATVSPALL